MGAWNHKFPPLWIALAVASATPMFADERAKGARVFDRCKSCHSLSSSADKKVGPPLAGIVGKPAASAEGYKYSNALLNAAAKGLVWTPQTLDEFLINPNRSILGIKMRVSGLKEQVDRDNLIAFLVAYDDAEAATTIRQDPAVNADILALQGDVEYGKYLSSSCVTCHQADGSDQGLPSIIGWPKKPFVTAMHAYKSKHRNNPVMQQHAGALSNEEIAALAAYFEGAE
ncbi:MAG: c-type cytochrome [Rhodobacteraceae bacterium]|nr:c-type cytochrome [Paracoccaceae bacterium]